MRHILNEKKNPGRLGHFFGIFWSNLLNKNIFLTNKSIFLFYNFFFAMRHILNEKKKFRPIGSFFDPLFSFRLISFWPKWTKDSFLHKVHSHSWTKCIKMPFVGEQLHSGTKFIKNLHSGTKCIKNLHSGAKSIKFFYFLAIFEHFMGIP